MSCTLELVQQTAATDADAVMPFLLGCPWPELQRAECCTCISTLPPGGQPVTATTGQNAPAMGAMLAYWADPGTGRAPALKSSN